MSFTRQLQLEGLKLSAFVFGPRMTGKTFLLRQLECALFIDLLDPEIELNYRHSPRHFWERISALPEKSLVIVDEVQKVPALLDYVQKGIEEKSLRFILSGSSARKLKRGGANLLGGRALDLHLHPLTAGETGKDFQLETTLKYGSLPKVVQLILGRQLEDAKGILRAYNTIYIKEEIQAEALTRNVGAFQRFFSVAAQSNGAVIEFANISRECSVPMSTVKEYYSILEDTLLGFFLWPWDRSERKKARPKFYFFDTGVTRAIQDRLNDDPTPLEKGVLFEQWFVNELRRLRDYSRKDYDFAFWRHGRQEVDILVMKGGKPVLAFECKTGRESLSSDTLDNFQKHFPGLPLFVVSARKEDHRRLDNGLEVLPFSMALDKFLSV